MFIRVIYASTCLKQMGTDYSIEMTNRRYTDYSIDIKIGKNVIIVATYFYIITSKNIYITAVDDIHNVVKANSNGSK